MEESGGVEGGVGVGGPYRRERRKSQGREAATSDAKRELTRDAETFGVESHRRRVNVERYLQVRKDEGQGVRRGKARAGTD